MEITLKIKYEIDGECSNAKIVVEEAILENMPQVLISEDYDGTDNWAILIESIEVIEHEI